MKKKTFRLITLPIATVTLAFSIALPVCANNPSIESAADMYFGKGQMHTVSNTGFKGDTEYVKSNYKSNEEVEAAAKDLSKKIEEEGIVLLKNSSDALPLAKNNKVTLFGRTSVDPIYVGSGSGSLAGNSIDYIEAMKNEGFDVNQKMVDFYKNHAKSQAEYQATDFASWQGVTTIKVPGRGFASNLGTAKFFGDVIAEVNADDIKADSDVTSSFSNYGDAAVVVIGRIGGEGCDLPEDLSGDEFNYPSSVKARTEADKQRHYLELNDDEISMLKYVKSLKDANVFKKVVVLVNSSNAMELGFLNDAEYGVDSALWVGDIGCHGATAIAEVLDGTVNPSGRLVDTYLGDVYDNPAMRNFGDYSYSNLEKSNHEQKKFVQYEEGIYEGYRYYETASAENAFDFDSKVIYPFGFGMSYTSFTQEFVGNPVEKGNNYEFTVKVKNTGLKAGKTPVELYAETPYTKGGIEKSKVVLAAFNKTNLIEPNAEETVTLTVSKDDLASYDYKTERAYVLDSGTYKFYVDGGVNGSHCWSKETTGKVELTMDKKTVFSGENKRESDDVVVTNQFDDVSAMFKDTATEGFATNLSRADFVSTYPTTPTEKDMIASADIIAKSAVFDVNNDAILGNTSTSVYNNVEAPKTKQNVEFNAIALRGLSYDDPAYDVLLDTMDPSQIAALFVDGGYKTQPIEGISLPGTVDYDGPAGWSGWVSKDGLPGVSEGFPTEIVLASTWNAELAEDYGEIIGEEALTNKLNGWYAPAMNIHRTAFAGRNFEYFSEDPLLSGQLGARTMTGAGKKGVYSYVKHFALNDQETNRWGILTWANEQAMREIYLRPFETAIKNSYVTVNYYESAESTEMKTTTLKGPMAIMNSYNCLGATWSGASYALMTQVLRNEWGFNGIVSTDFYGGDEHMNPDGGLRAGTDVFLATFAKPTIADTTSDASLVSLRRVMHDVVYTVVNSNAMNGIAFDSSIYYETSTWKKWVYAGMGLCIAVTAGLVAWNVVVSFKKKEDENEAK